MINVSNKQMGLYISVLYAIFLGGKPGVDVLVFIKNVAMKYGNYNIKQVGKLIARELYEPEHRDYIFCNAKM